MANWYAEATKSLLEIARTNAALARIVRASIQKIEEDPEMGQFIAGSLRIYTNQPYRFRIGYSYNPGSQSPIVEIIEIGQF